MRKLLVENTSESQMTDVDCSAPEGGKGELAPLRAFRYEPSKEDLQKITFEAIEYLVSVVRSRPAGRQAANGIAAAARLLEYTRWREEYDGMLRRADLTPESVMNDLLGGPEKLLSWMREMLPVVEARVRGREGSVQ